MKGRQPKESVRAMNEVLDTMGNPETLFHDFFKVHGRAYHS